ncbi:Rha family transcriptional regulator [Levilactobacillus brevis]
MNDLVFLSSQQVDAEPLVTGDVIADHVGLSHHAVNSTINKYLTIIKRKGNGHVTFEMQRTEAGRLRKVYLLNEKQSSFLITLFKNTAQVVDFKDQLNEEFYAMQRELVERRAQFELGKQFSKSLHATIADSQIKMHGHEYSTFNRLIYKQALGVDSTKLRKARDIPKGEAITTYLSSDEAEAVRLVKNRVEVLLDVGMDYQQIKQALQIKGVVYKVTLQLPVKN